MPDLNDDFGPMSSRARPADYAPPTCARDLLARYASGERYFVGADLGKADLRGKDLRGADLRRSCLLRADLCGANLARATLDDADLRLARLHEANLEWALLRRSVLRGLRAVRADLRHADLAGADLTVADLRGADLRGASFLGAELDETLLFLTAWSRVTLGGTILANLNLSMCKDLEEVVHSTPSVLARSTFLLSRGRIPAAFVLGCGPSDWGTLATSSGPRFPN